MTFVITETCIDTMDQACVEVCPVDCIHFEEGQDRMLYIDPTECIDCGACQPACPVSAIFPEGDVPGNLAHFTEINTLWYQDRAAARARVGGGGGAAAPAAAAPAAEAPAAEAPAGDAPASDAPAAAAEAPAAASAAAPAATAVATAEPEPQEAVMQVPATVGAPPAPAASTYNLPSPWGFISLAAFAAMFYVMWVFPGPHWMEIGGVGIGASIIVLAPLAIIALLLFIGTQARDLSLFASHHDTRGDYWREAWPRWRRNEETRRYAVVEAVQSVAGQRFAYPNDEHPDLRTYVNLPEPQFGVEPRGTGEKLFPDIVSVSYPGNYPIAIAQVETPETVSLEQATYTWARLDNSQCPLYLYVPAGMANNAKRHAKRVGIKNVRFRTWRWTPTGVVVREV